MANHKYATSPPNLTTMPPGVPYIIGNEAAERFSYYGMKSILTVFMAHYILNKSGALAPMDPNEAYKYTHYFVSGVYGETSLDDFLDLANEAGADPEEQRTFVQGVSDPVNSFRHLIASV